MLDEAQAIKNGRTRVARACWALRGKRRWCLSGTPVQNHVSDLWSVFRFLRYRPFDDPRAFREHVLDAMREDQSNGYDRLRVILTQVALRRTKSTKINGEPVVRLPKRIDHVEQLELGETERQCYEALECESLAEMEAIDARAHMTMQSNTGEPTRYAYALRMLLRLRQACDDMSLVRGGSPQFLACRTKAIAAGHAALPRGQAPDLATVPPGESTPPRMVAVDAADRARLLSLIEGGEAECHVCHDAVEDPVVSFSCRHVFCSECASTQLAEASGRDDDECWLCPAFGCGKPIRPQDILSRAQLCDGAMDAVGTPGAAPEATNGLSAQSLSAPSVGASRPAVLGSHCSTKVRAVLTYMDTLSRRCGWPRVRASDGVPLSVLLANGTLGKSTVTSPGSAAKKHVKVLGPGCSSMATVSSLPKLPPLPPAPGPPPGTETLEKVVLFSQWTSMLDILEEKMRFECYPYRRIDGSMAVAKREEALSDFRQSTHESPRILLASLKAASVGLNLACANHVMLVDPWWNPTTEEQAIDRCHRLGQRREVHVVRFRCVSTVEDRIWELQSQKRELVGAVMEGKGGDGATAGASFGGRQRLSMNELMWLFKAKKAGGGGGGGGGR